MTKKINQKHIYLIVGLVIIALYILPFLILKENSPVLIHDNFDEFYFSIIHNGEMFGPLNATIPQIMNDIPRNCFKSELNIIILLFYFFPPFTAYVLNLTIMHLIAFFGMYLLLTRHFVKSNDSIFIAIGVALAFALIPFWPEGGLSVVGMPFALYAFLNIRNNDYNITDWFILIFIPFYSIFVYSYFFFLIGIGLIWLYDFIGKKSPNPIFLCSIVFMMGIFLVVEYRLIYLMFFDSGFISDRIEWFNSNPLNFKEAINAGLNELSNGFDNVISGQQFWIMIATVMAMICILRKLLKKEYFFVCFLLPSMITLNLIIYTTFPFGNDLTFLLIISTLIAELGLIIGFVSYDNLKNRKPISGYFLYLLLIMGLGLFTNSFFNYQIAFFSAISIFWNLFWIILCLVCFLLAIHSFLILYSLELPIKLDIFSEKTISPDEYLLIVLILICIGISVFFGLYSWEGLSDLLQKNQIIRIFQFDRFIWLQPLIWSVIFAISLFILNKIHKYGKFFVIFLIICQVFFLISYDDHFSNQAGGIALMNNDGITYSQFYSNSLFTEIKDYINLPQNSYRVVNIGIEPSIAIANGFYALDGYVQNYPIDYKHKFREIIADELAKNEEIRLYFDSWGSRCYLFTSETSTNSMIKKDSSSTIQNLTINTTALKNLGGKYIFSAIEIKNYEENNLTYLRNFTNPDSPFKIWLYEVS
jgi:hypothetical protein